MKRRLLYAIALGIFVFAVLTLPFKRMGLDSDSIGFVYHFGSISSGQELIAGMSQGMEYAYSPLNEASAAAKPGFLGFFRPLSQLCFYVASHFFQQNAWDYYLLHIFFHALFCVILFLIYSEFLSALWASFLTLLFAFHPALSSSHLGITCFITPTYCLVAAAVLAYIYYYRTSNMLWGAGAASLFFIALCFYELPFGLVLVLLGYLFLFDYRSLVRKSLIILASVAAYLATRFWYTDTAISFEKKSLGLEIKKLVSQVFENVTQAIKPFWGIQEWSKAGAFVFTVGFLVLLIWFFLQAGAEKRKLAFFYSYAFIAASWPIIIANSSTRYCYLGLPFFCLLLFELIQAIALSLSSFYAERIVAGMLFFCLGWSGLYCRERLSLREQLTYERDQGFNSVAELLKQGEGIVLLGGLQSTKNTVFIMQSGISQAFKLIAPGKNISAYHVKELALCTAEYDAPVCDVEVIPNGYRFVSPAPQKLYFMCPYAWEEGTRVEVSMGTIAVNRKISGWQASDVSFEFNNLWKERLKKAKCITWNTAQHRFDMLPFWR